MRLRLREVFKSECRPGNGLTPTVQPPNGGNVKYRAGHNLRDAVNFSRFKYRSAATRGNESGIKENQYSVIITANARLPPRSVSFGSGHDDETWVTAVILSSGEEDSPSA